MLRELPTAGWCLFSIPKELIAFDYRKDHSTTPSGFDLPYGRRSKYLSWRSPGETGGVLLNASFIQRPVTWASRLPDCSGSCACSLVYPLP